MSAPIFDKDKAKTLAACEMLRSQAFCSAEVNASMEAFDPEVYGADVLERYLFDKVLRALTNNGVPVSEIDNCPTSISSFIDSIAPAFNASYLKHLESCCERFERLVHGFGDGRSQSFSSGTTFTQTTTMRLSDVFIQERSVSSWTRQICNALAAACFKSLDRQDTVKHRPRISQFDGPSGELQERDTIHAGVAETGGPFAQVTLVGRNLPEAWNSVAMLRSLEAGSRLSRDWTPAQPGSLFVYHGTKAPGERFSRDLARRPFDALIGRLNQNQVTPTQRSLPVVWTAFSPLCAFLWAVFAADVISNCPGYSHANAANESWGCGGHTYQGVALLQFGMSQPSPVGCTSYTIPANQEAEWFSLAKSGHQILEPNASPPTQWSYFRTIHRQEVGTDWPNVVHGLELLASRQTLRPFTTQFWRSVWSGAGIDALNAGHEKSFAIRFSIIGDTESSPQNLETPPP